MGDEYNRLLGPGLTNDYVQRLQVTQQQQLQNSLYNLLTNQTSYNHLAIGSSPYINPQTLQKIKLTLKVSPNLDWLDKQIAKVSISL